MSIEKDENQRTRKEPYGDGWSSMREKERHRDMQLSYPVLRAQLQRFHIPRGFIVGKERVRRCRSTVMTKKKSMIWLHLLCTLYISVRLARRRRAWGKKRKKKNFTPMSPRRNLHILCIYPRLCIQHTYVCSGYVYIINTYVSSIWSLARAVSIIPKRHVVISRKTFCIISENFADAILWRYHHDVRVVVNTLGSLLPISNYENKTEYENDARNERYEQRRRR